MITLPRLTGLLVGAVVGLATLPAPAGARVFVGVGIGIPVVPYDYPPPVYAPPPVYYPPPPVYYPPPPVAYSPAPAGYGAACYAGVYTCPVDRALPVGTQCSCPGIGAPSYGTVR